MKKILLAALLAVALLITLVACSNDKKEETTTAAEQLTTFAGETANTIAEEKATTVAEQATTIAGENATTVAEEATTVAEAVTTVEEATTEEETTDPSVPVLLFDADFIYNAAATNPNQATAEMGYKSVNLTSNGNDPYFTLASDVKAGAFAVIKYKSAIDASGQFFVGSSGGPSGQGDCITFDYDATEGEWDYAMVDLTESANYDGKTVAYLRYDFFTGNEGETLNVAWIAFFDDVYYATTYTMLDTFNVEILAKDDPDSQYKLVSFDTFYVNGESLFDPAAGVGTQFTDEYNDTLTFKYGQKCESIIFRGWSVFEQPIAKFGYYVKLDVDMGEGAVLPVCFFVPNPEFATDRSDIIPVIATWDGFAEVAEFAQGYEIEVDLTDLTYGAYTVGVAAELADGRVVSMYEITVELEEAEDVTTVGAMSPDVYYEDGEAMQIGSAHEWLAANRENGIYGVDTIAFHGWAHMGDAVVADFGYALGNSGYDEFFFGFEPELDNAIIPILNNNEVRRFTITIPVSELPEGTYELKLLVKDGDGNVYQMKTWGELYVTSFGQRPDDDSYNESSDDVELGITPRNDTPVTKSESFGYKFTLGENEYLNSISVVDFATYDDLETKGTLDLYYWSYDLETTREYGYIGTVNVINPANCKTLTVDVSKFNLSDGDFYYEFNCTETSKTDAGWTPWGVSKNADGCVGFVGDNEVKFGNYINVSTYEEVITANIASMGTLTDLGANIESESNLLANLVDGKSDTAVSFPAAEANFTLGFDQLYYVKKIVVDVEVCAGESALLFISDNNGTTWVDGTAIYAFQAGESGEIEIPVNMDIDKIFIGRTNADAFIIKEVKVIADVTNQILPFSVAKAQGGGQSTDSYFENGEMIVDGSAAKWLGGTKQGAEGNRIDGINDVDNASFRGWVGIGNIEIAEYGYKLGNDAIVWSDEFYIEAEPELAGVSGQPNVTRYMVTVDFTGIVVNGEYKIDILVRDENGVIYKIDKWDSVTSVKFVKNIERPDAEIYNEVKKDLFQGSGDPAGAVVGNAGMAFGYKFTLKDGQFLNSITILKMATFNDPNTVGTVTFYVWQGSVAATRASAPIAEFEITNHADNQDLVIDVAKYNLTGSTFYYECKSTVGKWTPWGAADGNSNGCKGYVNLDEVAFRASMNVSTYEAKTE